MYAVTTLLRTGRLVLLALGCLWTVQTWAQADQSEQVKQRFQAKFQHMPVEAVSLTPYGLYELYVGGELLYTDEAVSYVFQGTLIDTASRTNVTTARLEQLSAVPFDQLPLELAFTQVRGSGAQKIAIFEDPNCGYCKQLRHTLQQIDDVTIHTFMYPILSPDSTTKVEAVWCTEDKGTVWDAWMLSGRVPPNAQCNAPVADLVALGKRLNVRGTPTIIFENGQRVSGALPLAALQERMRAAHNAQGGKSGG